MTKNNNGIYTLSLRPMPSVRTTHGSRFNEKTKRYESYKAAVCAFLRILGAGMEGGEVFRFVFPPPKSKSKKAAAAMLGQLHTQTPDTDNLVKPMWDAVLAQDGHMWLNGATKVWGESEMDGCIQFFRPVKTVHTLEDGTTVTIERDGLWQVKGGD